MAKKSIVKEKAEAFASEVIRIYRILTENREYMIANQLSKSGTSIGANINEVIAGESVKDKLVNQKTKD